MRRDHILCDKAGSVHRPCYILHRKYKGWILAIAKIQPLAENVYAANIAYKHQQMVEMLPFFVRPDFQSEDNLKSLSRVPHFLRTSPGFTKGNIKHPYPMHLGITLIEDLLCILDLD